MATARGGDDRGAGRGRPARRAAAPRPPSAAGRPRSRWPPARPGRRAGPVARRSGGRPTVLPALGRPAASAVGPPPARRRHRLHSADARESTTPRDADGQDQHDRGDHGEADLAAVGAGEQPGGQLPPQPTRRPSAARARDHDLHRHAASHPTQRPGAPPSAAPTVAPTISRTRAPVASSGRQGEPSLGAPQREQVVLEDHPEAGRHEQGEDLAGLLGVVAAEDEQHGLAERPGADAEHRGSGAGTRAVSWPCWLGTPRSRRSRRGRRGRWPAGTAGGTRTTPSARRSRTRRCRPRPG